MSTEQIASLNFNGGARYGSHPASSIHLILNVVGLTHLDCLGSQHSQGDAWPGIALSLWPLSGGRFARSIRTELQYSFELAHLRNSANLLLCHHSLRSTDLDDAAKARLANAAKDRLVKGFRDNTWFVQTHGTDYELQPPASKRAAVVRTIYAEADGVEIPDTDTASHIQKSFTWMTVHKYTPDKQVTYPFKDIKSLEAK